jgi:uncharacterized protein
MTRQEPLPPKTGLGLKPQHYSCALGLVEGAVQPPWVEVHPQNYMSDGGPPHRWLTAIREELPVSFHSTGLSLGSAGGLDRDELLRLKSLVARYQPASVSDHLSWSVGGGNLFPDLLPLPYTAETLAHFVAQVSRVQDALKREILVENPSRYLSFACDEMEESEFLSALCRSSGCGVLLDINNIEVSAKNLGLDATACLDAINPVLVGEVHLAGHAVEIHEGNALLIDDHGSPVGDACWSLYTRFIARAGPVPTLIEWDTNVPDYAILFAEARKAETIMEAARHVCTA